MRTLCLNLQTSEKPSVAEGFLSFSPRVQFREPGFIFADITDTSSLFGSEKELASEALKLSQQFYPESSLAVADSPWVAQALAETHQLRIVPPTEEDKELSALPLEALKNLEGLIAWNSVNEVEEIISFFRLLGLNSIGEIRQFQSEAFRERWGQTGSLLWKRLHGLDRQTISPLLPEEALTEYVHLDFPVSLLPFLTHCVEKRLDQLFHRLQGRGEFAQKIRLNLFCEYSNKCHLIEVTPASACRDKGLFLKLLENKLLEVNLDNPIREFELEAIPCPEKIQQLDFFGPQEEDQDKLKKLVSLFNQANVATGFFRPKDEIFPENCWDLTPEFQNALTQNPVMDYCGTSFQFKPSYSHKLHEAPRPTRLLEKPQRISDTSVMDLHFLSDLPIERFEDSWWQETRGRDYYVALNLLGQLLWVFYDHIEQEYFIHGYFD